MELIVQRGLPVHPQAAAGDAAAATGKTATIKKGEKK
jgi:hypothetical protein